jgi:GTP cyclohydrolase FolE2
MPESGYWSAGFSSEQAEQALSLIPVASHNQRQRYPCVIGSDQDVQAEDLVRIIETSMSSGSTICFKRPDELLWSIKPIGIPDLSMTWWGDAAKRGGGLS